MSAYRQRLERLCDGLAGFQDDLGLTKQCPLVLEFELLDDLVELGFGAVAVDDVDFVWARRLSFDAVDQLFDGDAEPFGQCGELDRCW